MAMNDNTAVTAPAGDYMVRIEGLRKSFGDLEVLRDVNLEVAPGEVVTIIGASGSGKSTLLRCINLLETPDAGHVWFQGSDLTADHVDVNCYARTSAWSSRDSTCSTTWMCWQTARWLP